MKYLKHKQSSRMPCVLLTISLMALAGCAEWSSTPARVQADYGNSVRSLVSNQIYNPEKARHPAALLPDGMEGNKADSVLNDTYRAFIVKPTQTLTHPSVYGIDGRGSGISKSGGPSQ
jgi:hypothetical protein